MFLRRHLVSVAIAVVTVLLGVYLFWFDSGRVTTNEANARKRNLIQAYRRADISELVIQQKDEVIRISQRRGDAGDSMYYLGDGELADQSAVDKVLGVLEFATPERRIEGAIDRQAMGLDSPRIILTLNMAPVSFRLAVGSDAPAPKGAAYAEVDGSTVVVISRDLVTALSRPRDTYRSRTLVPYLSTNLAEIQIDSALRALRFSRGSWGGWAVQYDEQKIRVNRDAFDRLLTSFADLKAEAFVSEADAEKVLVGAKEFLRIRMTPSDAAQPPAVLDLGGVCPDHPEDVVAVRNEPGPKKAACVPKGVLEVLSAPLSDLADRHLFSLRTDEMEQLTLASGDKKLDLVRSGSAWHMRAPTEGSVENDVGQAFARTLQDLVGEEIMLGRPDAKTEVRATATITRADANDDPAGSETVELGGDAGEGFSYVKRLEDGAILKVAKDAAQSLIPSSFSLRSRKIIDDPLAHVQRIAIDGEGVHQVLLRSPSGGWSLDVPKSLAVDPSLATDVAEALCQLRAERWVADDDNGSFGLERPRASFSLAIEAGATRVDVGSPTSGGAFARRDGLPGVFVLPEATLRTLETWAVDRSYFVTDPKELRRVELFRGSDRKVIEPPEAGAKPTSEQASFEVVRGALADLRTEGMVHLGEARKEEGFDKPLLRLSVVRASSAPGAPAAPPTTIKITIGRGDSWRDTSVFYARREGIDATFAIAQSKVRPLLDAK